MQVRDGHGRLKVQVNKPDLVRLIKDAGKLFLGVGCFCACGADARAGDCRGEAGVKVFAPLGGDGRARDFFLGLCQFGLGEERSREEIFRGRLTRQGLALIGLLNGFMRKRLCLCVVPVLELEVEG